VKASRTLSKETIQNSLSAKFSGEDKDLREERGITFYDSLTYQIRVQMYFL